MAHDFVMNPRLATVHSNTRVESSVRGSYKCTSFTSRKFVNMSFERAEKRRAASAL